MHYGYCFTKHASMQLRPATWTLCFYFASRSSSIHAADCSCCASEHVGPANGTFCVHVFSFACIGLLQLEDFSIRPCSAGNYTDRILVLKLIELLLSIDLRTYLRSTRFAEAVEFEKVWRVLA